MLANRFIKDSNASIEDKALRAQRPAVRVTSEHPQYSSPSEELQALADVSVRFFRDVGNTLGVLLVSTDAFVAVFSRELFVVRVRVLLAQKGV